MGELSPIGFAFSIDTQEKSTSKQIKQTNEQTNKQMPKYIYIYIYVKIAYINIVSHLGVGGGVSVWGRGKEYQSKRVYCRYG